MSGAALSYCGFALMTNYRGSADWFEEAERKRRELSKGGTVWRPEHIGSSRGYGVAVLLLGVLFLVGGVTST